jgi:hypothetical protein
MVVIFYILVVFNIRFLDTYKSPRIVFSAAGDSKVLQRCYTGVSLVSLSFRR